MQKTGFSNKHGGNLSPKLVDFIFVFSLLFVPAALYLFYKELLGITVFLGADATFYNQAGNSLFNKFGPIWFLSDFSEYVAALFQLSLSQKYWGFFTLNYLAASLYPSDPLFQSMFLRFTASLCWAAMLVHAANNNSSGVNAKRMLYLVGVLLGWYMVSVNYRDCYTGVLVYLVGYFLVRKFSLGILLVLSLILFFFRSEFLLIIFAAYLVSLLVSQKIRVPYWLQMIVVWLACVALFYLLFPHKLSSENFALFPIAIFSTNFLFVTASLLQIGEPVNTNFIWSMACFAVGAVLLFTYLFSYCSSSSHPFLENKKIKSFVLITFVFVYSIYVLRNGGFQPRIAGSIWPILFLLPIFDGKIKSVSLILVLSLTALIGILNVRSFVS